MNGNDLINWTAQICSQLPKRPLLWHLPSPRAPSRRVVSSISSSFVLRLSLKQQKTFSIVPLTHFSPHQYIILTRFRSVASVASSRVYFSSSAPRLLRSPASEWRATPANRLSEIWDTTPWPTTRLPRR
jgi:hypothetical protein